MSLSSVNRLKQMAIFCKVIDRGSMRAAAEELGMTASAVSQHISQLERELEVPLIYRSTRKLSLSEAGERYFLHGRKMLMAAEDAEDAIHEIKQSLEGELRISAPVGLASLPLASALKTLLEGNQGLCLTVLAHDRSIDLVEEHIDIAIRVGEPEESSFIYHSLSRVYKSIYASPAYLKKCGNPVIPDDLKNHTWLGLMSHSKFSEVKISHSNKSAFEYQPNFRMRFNDLNALTSHVQAGFGLAVLPDLEVRHLVDNGSLIRVLPEWSTEGFPLYALTIDRKQSFKVKAAIKELKSFFGRDDPTLS